MKIYSNITNQLTMTIVFPEKPLVAVSPLAIHILGIICKGKHNSTKWIFRSCRTIVNIHNISVQWFSNVGRIWRSTSGSVFPGCSVTPFLTVHSEQADCCWKGGHEVSESRYYDQLVRPMSVEEGTEGNSATLGI